MVLPETMADKITGAADTSPQRDPPMDNHPAGRHLPGVANTNMIGKGESGMRKHASPQREYESEDCPTSTYGEQRIEAGYNLSPPSLIESDDESESDTEADATTATFLNHRANATPGTVNHASGKVILGCETRSVPLKNMDIIRRRYVQDSDSGNTTTDIEECTNSGTGYKMCHHPVGRES